MSTSQIMKKQFAENEVAAVIKKAFSFAGNVSDVYYSYNESSACETVNVVIEYDDGEKRTIDVDVTADSLSALLYDVVRAMKKYY